MPSKQERPGVVHFVTVGTLYHYVSTYSSRPPAPRDTSLATRRCDILRALPRQNLTPNEPAYVFPNGLGQKPG